MSKNPITIRIVSIITLAAFIATQAGPAYALRARATGETPKVAKAIGNALGGQPNTAIAGGVQVYDKSGNLIDDYPKWMPYDVLHTLDKVTVKVTLTSAGVLRFGRKKAWAQFGKKYGNRQIEADMEGGFVIKVRIYKKNPEGGIEKEVVFSQLVDKQSDKIVWTWLRVLSPSKFKDFSKKYPHIILRNFCLDNGGHFFLGRTEHWAQFGDDFSDRQIEADIEDGFVTKVRIYKENPTEGFDGDPRVFSQLVDRDTGKIVWTWWGGLTTVRFKKLWEEHSYLILRNFSLDGDGGLFFGRVEIGANLGDDFSDRQIEADIEDGFVTKVRIYKENPTEGFDGDPRVFSQLVDRDTGKIVWTWCYRLRSAKLRGLAKEYPHLILKKLNLDNGGGLSLGGMVDPWATFGKTYTCRQIEADIEDGFVTRVRIYKENPEDGIDGDPRVFSQLVDRDTGKIVWTYWARLTSAKFGMLAARHPQLMLKYRILGSSGKFFIAKRGIRFNYKFPLWEIEADIDSGEFVQVRLVWQEDDQIVVSRAGPVFGRREARLFPQEEDFILDLAAAGPAGLDDETRLLVSETLVRLQRESLKLLRDYGLLTQQDMEGIIELDLKKIDAPAIFGKISDTMKGYRELGLSDQQINQFLSTHIPPLSFIFCLQRVYRLGDDLTLILQASRHPDMEAWIKRYRDAMDKRGTLDRKKHLTLYDPQKNALLTQEQEAALLEDLKQRLRMLHILAAQEEKEAVYDEIYAKTTDGYILTLAKSPRDIMPGMLLYTQDRSMRFEVVKTIGNQIQLREISDRSMFLPKRGKLFYNPQDVTYSVQAEILGKVVRNLEQSGLKTTGYPGMDRLLGLAKDTSKTDLEAMPALEFFNQDILRREVNGETKGDESQEVAVMLALFGSKQLIINASAGVGKTTVIVEVIRQYIRGGKNVLLVSQMNQGIDNALQAFIDDESVPVLRLGNELAPSAVANGTDKLWINAESSGGITEFARRAGAIQQRTTGKAGMLLGATSISVVTDKGLKRLLKGQEPEFDLIIMDETSLETLQGALVPLQYLTKDGRLVLVGDSSQLQPFSTREDIAKLKEEGATDNSVTSFYRSVLKDIEATPRVDKVTLMTIWRSIPLLAGMTSEVFYEGELHMRGWEDFDEDTLSFKVIDVAEEEDVYYEQPVGTSFRNPRSAQEVLSLIEQYHEKRQIALKDISIVTPYNPQVELLQDLIRKKYPKVPFEELPQVSTIDSFMGGENNAIIIDMVRSNDKGQIGFIKDMHRLRVAFSRAKDNLAIVWDSRVFDKEPVNTPEVDKQAREVFRQIRDYYKREVLTFFPDTVESSSAAAGGEAAARGEAGQAQATGVANAAADGDEEFKRDIRTILTVPLISRLTDPALSPNQMTMIKNELFDRAMKDPKSVIGVLTPLLGNEEYKNEAGEILLWIASRKPELVVNALVGVLRDKNRAQETKRLLLQIAEVASKKVKVEVIIGSVAAALIDGRCSDVAGEILLEIAAKHHYVVASRLRGTLSRRGYTGIVKKLLLDIARMYPNSVVRVLVPALVDREQPYKKHPKLYVPTEEAALEILVNVAKIKPRATEYPLKYAEIVTNNAIAALNDSAYIGPVRHILSEISQAHPALVVSCLREGLTLPDKSQEYLVNVSRMLEESKAPAAGVRIAVVINVDSVSRNNLVREIQESELLNFDKVLSAENKGNAQILIDRERSLPDNADVVFIEIEKTGNVYSLSADGFDTKNQVLPTDVIPAISAYLQDV